MNEVRILPPEIGDEVGIDIVEPEQPHSESAVGRHVFPDRSMAPLSLRANFSWTFAGNMVYAACQWGVLVVLAKLGTTEMVGQFALGLAVCAPVIMLTNLQLRAVQATDARREYIFGNYLALRLIATAIGLIIIVGIVVVAGYRLDTTLVILAIAVAKAFEALSDVFHGLLQQRERMDRIAKSLMIKGPLSLAAFGLGVYLTGSVLWGVVGMAAVWVLVLVSYDVRSGALILRASHAMGENAASDGQGEVSSLQPRGDINTLARLAWLALPLGMVMMLISLNTNIPRYFLERHHGEAALGIFAALAYVLVAGGKVMGALGRATTPRLAKYYASGDRTSFRKLLGKLLLIGALLGAVGVVLALLVGRPLLTLFYRPEYGEQVHVFVWIVIAAGIGYVASCLGYAMTAARHFSIQLPLFVLVAAASLGASFWLIPTYGLMGAALAMLAAVLVQVVGSAAVVYYVIHTSGKGAN